MTINQELLNTYFSTIWRDKHYDIGNYQFSGFGLIDRVQLGERVIDIGCGTNPFKGHIPNLIGIDPAFPEADYRLTLEDYIKSNSMIRYNVAFCLGSVDFGNQYDIEYQINLVVKLLRRKCGARIYWRSTPGNTEPSDILYYNWSFDEHTRLANLFNFEITEMEWDTNNTIFAEWIYKN